MNGQPEPSPSPVVDYPSLAYWRETDVRIKQFWYVSFCLMMSSVQDRLTGLALREAGNRNWATTAFYYSAVHAGRLLCFVCFGDYPTRHDGLARLLAGEGSSPVRLDWLSLFRRYVRASADGSIDPSPAGNSSVDRPMLEACIRTVLPGRKYLFDQFAPLLTKFKKLRNDCNYEALLVAHERNHFLVTEAFRTLVDGAEEVSRIAVDLATAGYLGNLQSDAAFAREREMFRAAHSEYVCGRLQHSLAEKFAGSQAALDELDRVTSVLAWTPRARDSGRATATDSFLAPIMYDTFGEKQGLMRRWRDDVTTLRNALTEDTER